MSSLLRIIDLGNLGMRSLSGLEQAAPEILDQYPSLKATLAAVPAASKDESSKLRQECNALSLCKSFFVALRNRFDLVLLALLDDKKDVCNIVSRLDTGDIVLVEAQVEKNDCLDKRFLAYATSLYSNQIREGFDWSTLKNVASVILISHDVSKSLGWSEHEYKRHYLLKNKLADGEGTNTWPYLQLILYCIPKVDLVKTDDPIERAWLEFFKNADKLEEVPPKIPEEVAKAYERVRRCNLPVSVILSMQSEDSHLRNMA